MIKNSQPPTTISNQIRHHISYLQIFGSANHLRSTNCATFEDISEILCHHHLRHGNRFAAMSYYSSSASTGTQQGAYGYAQTSATGQTSAAQAQAYAYAQQQAYAAQHATSNHSSSSRKGSSKDKKSSSSSRREQATLLEVEKQWAAYYEQQRAQGGAAASNQQYPEPDFTAFTLAGGKSYLEDGSPSPMSSKGRSTGSGRGY